MRATLLHAAGDVRVEDVPDASIAKPTDALVRITRSCICGSGAMADREALKVMIA